jgi:hypothetical protein
MTDRERLARIVHAASVEAYNQRRWAQAPWPDDLYEFVADYLLRAGVSLTGSGLDVDRLVQAFHDFDHPAMPDCEIRSSPTRERYCAWKVRGVLDQYAALSGESGEPNR